MSNKNRLLVGAIFAAFVLLSAGPAMAHKVNIFAWAEGDTVYSESYFGGGDRIKAGLVTVYGPDGRKLLEGRTNDRGEFSFKIPQQTDLKLVIDAGEGHRNDYTLKAGELSPGQGKTSAPEAEAENRAEAEPAAGTVAGADIAEIRAVVEEALDRRLHPLIREVAELRHQRKPGLTEIIGGIGYIVGLMGLIMFFRNRKK